MLSSEAKGGCEDPHSPVKKCSCDKGGNPIFFRLYKTHKAVTKEGKNPTRDFNPILQLYG